jgi:hypothetical protein
MNELLLNRVAAKESHRKDLYVTKEMAVSFLKMAGSGKVREAYERFIAPDFIHHNQYLKGDRESLMLAMEEASRRSPNKSIDLSILRGWRHRHHPLARHPSGPRRARHRHGSHLQIREWACRRALGSRPAKD